MNILNSICNFELYPSRDGQRLAEGAGSGVDMVLTGIGGDVPDRGVLKGRGEDGRLITSGDSGDLSSQIPISSDAI